MQLVEVEVMRLGLDRSTNSYVVILQEKGGARLLPIWIGQPEAESIVIEMNKLKRERPLTHDLCKNLIIGMGGTLRRVNITKVENRTFYAELHIARESGAVHIDARPSDSIDLRPGKSPHRSAARGRAGSTRDFGRALGRNVSRTVERVPREHASRRFWEVQYVDWRSC